MTHRRAPKRSPASSAETGADRQREPWPARWHFLHVLASADLVILRLKWQVSIFSPQTLVLH